MRRYITLACMCLVLFSSTWCASQSEHGCDVSTSRIRRISDFEATALHRVTPAYPPEAKTKGISGTVQLRVLVGKSGHVKAACPVYPDGTKPDSILIEAAQKAAVRWEFPRNFGLRGKLRLKFDYVEFPLQFNFAPSRPPEEQKQRPGALLH